MKTTGELFFTSDEHYYHLNIIKYCKRQDKDEHDMNERLIKNHNSVVSENDTVIHVGDVTAGLYGREDDFKELFKRLNGNHYLIRGNHDELSDKEYLDMGFTSVSDYLEYNGLFICHYPLNMKVRSDWITDEERNLLEIFKKSECEKIVHGHSHTVDYGLHRLNVACDLNNHTPVSYTKIKEEFENLHLRKERLIGGGHYE